MVYQPLLFLAALATSAQAEPATLPLAFTLAPAGAGKVQLTLEARSSANRDTMSRSFRIIDLSGLDHTALTGSRPAEIRFALQREAGTVACRGFGAKARATGKCRYTPDPRFQAELVRRGFGAPTLRQSYMLANSSTSLALADELKQQDYARLTVDGLVRCGIFGVTAHYVRAMAAAGYRLRSIDRLVTFRIHGITPEWVSGLIEASPSLARTVPDDLMAMRIHGVSPDWVRGFAAVGHRDISAKQLVAMRIHGVTPDFARRSQRAGLKRPSPEQLVSMRILGGNLDRQK